MMVRGDPVAPIKHLYLSEPSADRDLDNHTLQKIADKVHTFKLCIMIVHTLKLCTSYFVHIS